MKKNTIIVSSKRMDGTLQKAVSEVSIIGCNWVSREPKSGKTYSARTRYRQPLQKCRIPLTHGRMLMVDSRIPVRFESAQTVAPGQSLVFYDGDVCLGGGIIEKQN